MGQGGWDPTPALTTPGLLDQGHAFMSAFTPRPLYCVCSCPPCHYDSNVTIATSVGHLSVMAQLGFGDTGGRDPEEAEGASMELGEELVTSTHAGPAQAPWQVTSILRKGLLLPLCM